MKKLVFFITLLFIAVSAHADIDIHLDVYHHANKPACKQGKMVSSRKLNMVYCLPISHYVVHKVVFSIYDDQGDLVEHARNDLGGNDIEKHDSVTWKTNIARDEYVLRLKKAIDDGEEIPSKEWKLKIKYEISAGETKSCTKTFDPTESTEWRIVSRGTTYHKNRCRTQYFSGNFR